MAKNKGKDSKNNSGIMEKFLSGVEVIGNKLPDPAILFFIGLVILFLLHQN